MPILNKNTTVASLEQYITQNPVKINELVDGESALHQAINLKRDDLVSFLATNEHVDVNLKSKPRYFGEARTPIEMAMQAKSVNMILALLKNPKLRCSYEVLQGLARWVHVHPMPRRLLK